MGKKLVAILNHDPTPEQLKELEAMGWAVKLVKPGEVDPHWDQDRVYHFFLSLLVEVGEPEALWVQGDYRLFAAALRYATKHYIPVFVATTHRTVVEEKQPDGSVKKSSVFKHVRFVDVTGGAA
ncbi:MAG: hypothetical protein QXX12_01025 [Nanopusillaceae archaeon]